MPLRLSALAAVLALPLAASAAGAADAPAPSRAVAALVSHQAPKGWKTEEYANGGGADPVVAHVDGLDRITVRVFGAPGSGYKTPALFLSGAAASSMGRRPEAAGNVTVAGRRLALYKRGFPIDLGDPHAPSGPVVLGREIFCVLPVAGGRFVVLAYSRESPAPDLERRGEKAWENLLKTVEIPGRKT